MISLKSAVVVEGKYDKIKLTKIVDAPIITTDGFGVFKSEEKKALLRWYAKNGGIVILTDSDAAGFKIRGYIKGIVSQGDVRNVYIPDIFGKEKRKVMPSAEGKLGVEGVSETVIYEAFERAGIIGEKKEPGVKITRTYLYEDGLFGGRNSSQKRSELLKRLDLPENLSTSGLLDVLNSSMTIEEYKQTIENL